MYVYLGRSKIFEGAQAANSIVDQFPSERLSTLTQEKFSEID